MEFITDRFFGAIYTDFDIKPQNLKLKRGVSETIEATEFGHSDILDKPWSDFMHNTISRGSVDRDDEVLNQYKRW